LILDLKPLRISRLRIELAPRLMATTPWGYCFIDAQGEILLLDRDAQPIGFIHGPKDPTAMALTSPYTLLIATWHGQQGALYEMNLKNFDLDMLF
jgi:hypothetical protein